MNINIFDEYLSIISYDNKNKEVGNARVQAMTCFDQPMLTDAGEVIKYQGQLHIPGKQFSNKIPTSGNELKLCFEMEANRLRLTTASSAKTLQISKYINVPIIKKNIDYSEKKVPDNGNKNGTKNDNEYRESFGESATKLLSKIIDLFKDNILLFKFEDGYPISISGDFGTTESIKFYMVGKIPEDDDDDEE